MDMQPRHLEWRGVGPWGFHRLHALDWGDPRSRRVVVCVHGYSGNARDFDYLARRLARHARVICPDIAGRGESARLPEPFAYHFPQFLSDLRGMLTEIGADRVEWVGTSMGGLLGLILAAEPDSPITRLVLNDIGAFVPGEALRRIGRDLRAPSRFPSLDALEAHVRRTHREWGELTEDQWSHLIRHAARVRADGRYSLHYDPALARLMQFPAFAPGLSLWSAWGRVSCPVLIVRGARSAILPRDVVAKMLDVKPATEAVEIPNAGHAPSLMSPQEITLVARFLERARARINARPGISLSLRQWPSRS